MKQFLEFIDELSLDANNLIDFIERLFKGTNNETNIYSFKAISKKGTCDQQKFKIIILKYQYENTLQVLVRIQEIGLEEKLQSMKQKDCMISSFNHDMKNPIISSIYMIENAIKLKKQNKDIDISVLHTINYNLEIIMNLANGFLDYTSSKFGDLVVNSSKFDFYNSVQKIYDLMKVQTDYKNLELEYLDRKNVIFINNVKEIKIRSDKRRLQQILINLIGNSIKFTKSPGKIILNIQEFNKNNLLYIKVTDSGIGMQPFMVQNLFQAYQTSNDQNRNLYGTGIGLYTSKMIIKEIGPLNKIFVESEYNKGSEFSFFIYQDIQNQEIKHKLKIFNEEKKNILNFLEKEECLDYFDQPLVNEDINIIDVQQSLICDSFFFSNRKTNQKYVNILIVDDDKVQRLKIQDLLTKSQRSPTNYMQAGNGVDGLNIFIQQSQLDKPIHIIITDINMPFMDGYEMIRQITQQVQIYNFIKPYIIVTTSYVTEFHYKICSDLHVDQTLSKPVEFINLDN